jgi:hypothetical protein
MATKEQFEEAASEEPRNAEVIAVIEALMMRLELAYDQLDPTWRGFIWPEDMRNAWKLVARLKGETK